MSSHLVYTTSTAQALQQQGILSGIARVHAASLTSPRPRVYGMCLCCGSVEVELVTVTGTRDLSAMGESARYPTGFGCMACD